VIEVATPPLAGARSARPLQVLYVLPPTHTYAGIERVVDEMAHQLALDHSCSVRPTVLFLRSYAEIDLSQRAYGAIVNETGGPLDLVRNIRAAARSQPFDLVIVPQVEATVVAWLACLGLNRNFAVYLHGNPRFEKSHWKARVLFGLMRGLIAPRLAAVFGVSPQQLQVYRASQPSSAPHIWLPNPVRRFDTAQPSQPVVRQGVTFVNVGRYAAQKGQDILIEAFARVRVERPDARLRIVGFGQEAAALKDLAGRLGVAEAVDFEFHPNDPSPALASSDIFVSASRWEGWSLAICEALRFGLPVVATDCDFGPRDILTDTKLGRLVTAGSPEDLAAGMLACAETLVEERTHADFRRAYVARFDVKATARVHAAAIASVAAGERGARPDARADAARTTLSRPTLET